MYHISFSAGATDTSLLHLASSIVVSCKMSTKEGTNKQKVRFEGIDYHVGAHPPFIIISGHIQYDICIKISNVVHLHVGTNIMIAC